MCVFKSPIPLVKAVVALKRLEHDAQDKIPKDIKKKLQYVTSLLHKILRLNNIMFSEIQRKRKSDICHSLEKDFKPYAKPDSSEDHLFDEKTMKRMNQKNILILKLFIIILGADIFTNPRKAGVAVERPRRARVIGAKTTNITTNRKITDWGKRTI